ncbi:MAG: DUF2339 domain-containing protein [Actinobacteria bacterium]|nr:DUF2339 domain-containing protein [Actinomycetota bacterium]
MSASVLARLDRIESELRDLGGELQAIRATVLAGSPQPEPVAVEPQPLRVVAPPTPPRSTRAEPEQEPSGWERELEQLKRELPRLSLPKLDAADLLGARGLALAGGVVTLLGVVFFFVLAANNGWIGPLARVVLGGGASALVFAAAILLHARYGRLHAAVAAAGAGIAGGYATLLAAAALYDLVPALAALVLAGLIAGLGVALALHWSSQVVAALGLIGAMVVPAIVIVDGSLTVTGTAFVGIVFAAASVVSVRQQWGALLVWASAVSAPQILALVLAEDDPARNRTVALALVFVGLYFGAGIARQLAAGRAQLDSLASIFVAGGALLGGVASFALLEGDPRGIVLAALAASFGAVAIGFWRDETRELGALAAVFGTVFAATATAQFLDGPALVVAWSVEAVALGWLGRRIAETRFQLVALAYLALALLYTLEQAPLVSLYEANTDHFVGIPALTAIGLALVAYGLLARTWPPSRGGSAMPAALAQLIAEVDRYRRPIGIGAVAVGTLVLVDAASLGILGIAERTELENPFGWGNVAVTALWSLTALAVLTAGLLRRSRLLELGGIAGLCFTLLNFQFSTIGSLPEHRGWCAVVLAVAAAAAALLHGLLSRRVEVVPWVGAAISTILSGFVAAELFAGDARGYALAGIGAAHLLVAAIVFRRRDLATCFWLAALVLGLASSLVLLDHTWLVLAWTLAAVALAAAGTVLREPRLWLGAGAFTLLGGTLTIALLATPGDFLRANETPADGVPALLLVLGALAVLAVALRQIDRPTDALDRWLDSGSDELGRALRWTLATIGLYGASLAILGLVQELGTAGTTTAFQRGYTAVSAFWGLVALTILVVGLRRGQRVLRLAALGLFALALGKLFLYDLATLSSVARAASFLAVGAVLLLGGFFYQRLAEAEAGTES